MKSEGETKFKNKKKAAEQGLNFSRARFGLIVSHLFGIKNIPGRFRSAEVPLLDF